jgi:hypothetical protein
MDFNYGPEGHLLFNFGIEGETYKMEIHRLSIRSPTVGIRSIRG